MTGTTIELSDGQPVLQEGMLLQQLGLTGLSLEDHHRLQNIKIQMSGCFRGDSGSLLVTSLQRWGALGRMTRRMELWPKSWPISDSLLQQCSTA